MFSKEPLTICIVVSEKDSNLRDLGPVYTYPFSFENANFCLRFQKYSCPHNGVFESFRQFRRVRNHDLKAITAYLGSDGTPPSSCTSLSNSKSSTSCLSSFPTKTFQTGLRDQE